MSAETIQSRGTVVIRTDQCKGCELCIPACRPGVLKMSESLNEMGYRYPELFPGCTGCQACFQVCPDFVFDVYKFAQPVQHTVSQNTAPQNTVPQETTQPTGPGAPSEEQP